MEHAGVKFKQEVDREKFEYNNVWPDNEQPSERGTLVTRLLARLPGVGMGLDTVELVMDVEDHFGISIQLEEAEKVVTVGDLVALIQQRIAGAQRHPCATLAAFYAVRRIVRQVVADEAFRIRPSDKLIDKLTPEQIRELWRALPDKLNLFPDYLWLPQPSRLFVQIFAWGLPLLFLLLSVAVSPVYLIWGILIVTLVFIALTIWVSSWRCVPPPGWSTMAELTKKCAGFTIATKKVQLETPEQILQELSPIIVRNLGVKASDVTLQASFINDFGAD